MKSHAITNRIIALAVFIIASVVYLLTAGPSIASGTAGNFLPRQGASAFLIRRNAAFNPHRQGISSSVFVPERSGVPCEFNRGFRKRHRCDAYLFNYCTGHDPGFREPTRCGNGSCCIAADSWADSSVRSATHSGSVH